MNYALIFAGGVGSRMGSSTPKQFLEVDNIPIIIHVLKHFETNKMIDGIIIVSKAEYIDYCNELCDKFNITKKLDCVAGGQTGQGSIYNGLKALVENYSKDPANDIVLVHDGVRPMITDELITDNIDCVKKYGNSITVSKAIETVIRINKEGVVCDTVDRSECRNAKAPQCFVLGDIYKTHNKALEDGVTNAIDSATLMSEYGADLHTVECGPENIKITTPNDYYMFRAMYLSEKEGNIIK